MSKLYVGSLIYGCADFARNSVDSLLDSELEESTTFFLLDNGSPNTREIDEQVFLPAYERGRNEGKHVVTHVNPTNLGVSGGMNCLFRKAFEDPECEWMIYTAQDVVIHPKGIQNLVNRAKRGGVHFVTGIQARWEDPLPEPNESEGIGSLFMGHFLITRQLYEDVGGWDENFFPAYFEDNDYHARIVQAGYHKAAIGCCMSPVHHKTSATIKKYPELNSSFGKNSRYFREKWGGGPAETMKRLIAEFGEGVPPQHRKNDEFESGLNPNYTK
jgi:GT2 family glycosyltransferase